MPWKCSILPKADKDVLSLFKDPRQRQALESEILDEFSGMKGDRVTKLFKAGVSTNSIDKLSASRYPGSVRIQLGDHRATALCLPQLEMAFVTHVFHKSQDPAYKKAVPTHDARVAEFVEPFQTFVGKR